MSRGPMPSALRLATRSRRVTPPCRIPSRRSDWSSTWIRVRGTTTVCPPRKRLRLAHLRLFGHPDRKVALRDGDGADTHVRAHDDGAAGLVDDDDGRAVGLDAQVLDAGQHVDRVAPGQLQGYGARIGRPRRIAAQRAVDRVRHAPRGCQVRVAQAQPQHCLARELERNLPLDRRTIGDAGGRRHSARDRRSRAPRRERPRRQRALGHCIDLAIGAQQWRHEQRAARQVLGIS